MFANACGNYAHCRCFYVRRRRYCIDRGVCDNCLCCRHLRTRLGSHIENIEIVVVVIDRNCLVAGILDDDRFLHEQFESLNRQTTRQGVALYRVFRV
jgi:hypothetical protein